MDEGVAVVAVVVDVTTGVVTERPLTPEEVAQREIDRLEAEANWPVEPRSEADDLRAQVAALMARIEAAGL